MFKQTCAASFSWNALISLLSTGADSGASATWASQSCERQASADRRALTKINKKCL